MSRVEICLISKNVDRSNRTGKVYAKSPAIVGVFLSNLVAASTINPSSPGGGNVMEAFWTVCSPSVPLNYLMHYQVSHWLARELHAALLINY